MRQYAYFCLYFFIESAYIFILLTKLQVRVVYAHYLRDMYKISKLHSIIIALSEYFLKIV